MMIYESVKKKVETGEMSSDMLSGLGLEYINEHWSKGAMNELIQLVKKNGRDFEKI